MIAKDLRQLRGAIKPYPRTAQQRISAAIRVAEWLADLVPQQLGTLPRKYRVNRKPGQRPFLALNDDGFDKATDCIGKPARKCRAYQTGKITLEQAMYIASDLADGWLAELAEVVGKYSSSAATKVTRLNRLINP